MFERYQIWPTKNPVEWLQGNVRNHIDKQIRIASIGSCFAFEIKRWLKANGYDYVQTETSGDFELVFNGDKYNPCDYGSAAWERVYNTFTLRHIVEYTFEKDIEERLIPVTVNGKKYISDIIRSRILYKDLDTAKRDISKHIRCSREAFLSAGLLIITLGTTEIWRAGMTAATNPYKHYQLPNEFKYRLSGYVENLANMKQVYMILKNNNPRLKILITVSPVHILNSWRTDVDVMSASCESKSILRAVAGEMARMQDVIYFPSFEMATVAPLYQGNKIYKDGHHVSHVTINNIMKMI